MKIPHVGFILWAMTGHDMPPNFDVSVWDNGKYQRFLHDGDIVFMSSPKSGTLWLAQIIQVLRDQGEDNFDYICDKMGMIEMRANPLQTFEERVDVEQTKLAGLPA